MFLNATKKRMTDGSPPHPVVVRGCQFGFFESCKYSDTELEWLEPGSIQESMRYEKKRFVLLTKTTLMMMIMMIITIKK